MTRGRPKDKEYINKLTFLKNSRDTIEPYSFIHFFKLKMPSKGNTESIFDP